MSSRRQPTEDQLRRWAEEDQYRLRHHAVYGGEPHFWAMRVMSEFAARASGPPEPYVAFVMDYMREFGRMGRGTDPWDHPL